MNSAAKTPHHLTETVKTTNPYKLGFRWGMSDAAGGCMFSRYVKQHGEYCTVDYNGRATKLSENDGTQLIIARGYVDGCCFK